jgi:ribonuclease HI
LKYDWTTFIYTDGSYITPTTAANRQANIGAGVHLPHPYPPGRVALHADKGENGATLVDQPSASKTLPGINIYVQPEPILNDSSNNDADNTINRAELAAIYAAIINARQMYQIQGGQLPRTIKIATDSLGSIYQIRKMSHTPDAFAFHRHCHLLTAIVNQIHKLGIPVDFYKVRSHSGILGNEVADCIAKRIATSSSYTLPTPPTSITTSYPANRTSWTFNDVPPSNTRTGLYWPTIQKDINGNTTTSSPGDGAVKNSQLVDLNGALKHVTHHPFRLGHPDYNMSRQNFGIYFSNWRHLQPSLCTDNSHCIMHKKPSNTMCTVRWNQTRRYTLLCRSGSLFTQKLAHMWSSSNSPNCLLCGNEDSIGHILGHCPALKNFHIERHNRAARTVLHAIASNSRLAGSIVQCDIGSNASHFKADIIPALQPTHHNNKPVLQALKYIPSYLWKEDPHTQPSNPDITLYTPPISQQGGSLDIVELKFCSDTKPQSQYDLATKQHTDLIAKLRTRNPSLRVRQHIILVGFTGAIYTFFTQQPLSLLGVQDASLQKTLQHLHYIAVNSITAMLHQRAKLIANKGGTKQHPMATHPHPRSRSNTTQPTHNKRTKFDHIPTRCRHTTGVT